MVLPSALFAFSSNDVHDGVCDDVHDDETVHDAHDGVCDGVHDGVHKYDNNYRWQGLHKTLDPLVDSWMPLVVGMGIVCKDPHRGLAAADSDGA